MTKTIEEINNRIREGKAVVVTAEEIIHIAKEKGTEKAAKEVDVVTTGTFGPMCGSGAYLNLGHSKPRIKIGGGRAYLNDVPVYTGMAAVDVYLGATAIPDDDPRNMVFPGGFKYGGGHVIEDLVAGRDIKLTATAYGTDCYPRKSVETTINIQNINEAVLFNPRNSYQNYNVAVNISDKVIYTYMGTLQPRLGNANYCNAGQLSPLMNDPYYRTIGIGTRIFLGGGIGHIVWNGTQHNPCVSRGENGIPKVPAGTIAVIGDLKQMSHTWLRGTTFTGYGATLTVGIGIPIPILDEEILRYATVTDEDITAPVMDYSDAYPQGKSEFLGEVNYAQLKSGTITIQGKKIKTAGLSSYVKAKGIAEILKGWIKRGDFLLSQPIAPLPSVDSGISFKPMPSKPIKKK
ncbi:MAG: homocysteine biosynthesis protein [Thermodesulfobacteriota bacterium]|nr:homocysteine biosynthesis protein [Thermodesulfobacteriota bacterium]